MRVHRFANAGVSVVLILTLLSVSAVACGLIGGPEREVGPTPEPDIEATVAAAVSRVEATKEAASPQDSQTTRPASSPETPASASPTETTIPRDAAATLSTMGPDSTWESLIGSFTEGERSCIATELGEERLSQAMETPVFGNEPDQGWEPIVFACLEQETATALFFTMLTAQIGTGVELSEQDNACIKEMLADTDIAGLVAAFGPEPTLAQAEAMFAFFTGMAVCTPDLIAGEASGLQQNGSGSDETRLWSYPTRGWMDTAPTVVNGVVFVGSADGMVYALDAADGSEQWSFTAGDAVKSTPTVADGNVYVGSNDNHIYALDAKTGTELWSHDTGAPVERSPAVADGLVYVGTRSDGEMQLYALDATSGTTVWVAEVPTHPFGETVISVIRGQVYVPAKGLSGYQTLDARTGQPVWTTNFSGHVEAAPTVLDGVVYAPAVNQAYALAESTGDVIWSHDTERFPARDFPALVVEGIYYHSPDEETHALDAQTGETIWTYRRPSFLSAAPVVSDSTFFAATEAGDIIALEAQTGAQLWTTQADGMGLQALTVANGVLFLESDSGHLIAFDTADGRTIWKVQKGYVWGVGTYTVADRVVYFGSLDGSVNAHSAPVP